MDDCIQDPSQRKDCSISRADSRSDRLSEACSSLEHLGVKQNVSSFRISQRRKGMNSQIANRISVSGFLFSLPVAS